MVGEVSERVDDWLPRDVTDRAEIEAAVRDSGFPNDWGPGTIEAVADTVSDGRSLQDPGIAEQKMRQTTLFGGEDSRQAMVRATDGTVVGPDEKVRTWVDRWGNVMAHNSDTGTRKKIGEVDDT